MKFVLKMKNKRDGIKILIKINGYKLINKVYSLEEFKKFTSKLNTFKSMISSDGIA